MGYLIDYLEDKDIINIKIDGRINFGIAEKYSKEALKLSRDKACSKFILDHQATTMNNKIKNIHCSGEDLQQFGFKDSDKIAIIVKDPKQNPTLEDSSGDNISWSTFKYFNSNEIKKAFNWLTE